MQHNTCIQIEILKVSVSVVNLSKVPCLTFFSYLYFRLNSRLVKHPCNSAVLVCTINHSVVSLRQVLQPLCYYCRIYRRNKRGFLLSGNLLLWSQMTCANSLPELTILLVSDSILLLLDHSLLLFVIKGMVVLELLVQVF